MRSQGEEGKAIGYELSLLAPLVTLGRLDPPKICDRVLAETRGKVRWPNLVCHASADTLTLENNNDVIKPM